MPTQKVTDETFDRDVLHSEKPVLVDFWATWCGPCRVVAPILEALADDLKDVLRIAKVDVDSSPRVADRFRVTAIPTLMLFRDGRVVQAAQGALSKAQLTAWLENNLPEMRRQAVTVQDLRRRLSAGETIHLFDIRRAQDFARSHLRRARQAEAESLHSVVAALPRHESIVLICRTGDASKATTDRLRAQGFDNVFALEKGLLEWEGSGAPTYSTREEEAEDQGSQSGRR